MQEEKDEAPETIKIRPEQAAHIMKLSIAKDRAKQRWQDALEVALMGLIDSEVFVESILPDGTVVIAQPKSD